MCTYVATASKTASVIDSSPPESFTWEGEDLHITVWIWPQTEPWITCFCPYEIYREGSLFPPPQDLLHVFKRDWELPSPHAQSTNPFCLYWRLWLVYLVTFPKDIAGDRVVHCSNYEFQCFLKSNFCMNLFDFFFACFIMQSWNWWVVNSTN